MTTLQEAARHQYFVIRFSSSIHPFLFLRPTPLNDSSRLHVSGFVLHKSHGQPLSGRISFATGQSKSTSIMVNWARLKQVNVTSTFQSHWRDTASGVCSRYLLLLAENCCGDLYQSSMHPQTPQNHETWLTQADSNGVLSELIRQYLHRTKTSD